MVHYRQALSLKELKQPEAALEAMMTAMKYEPQNALVEAGFSMIFDEASEQMASGKRFLHE